MAAKFVVLFAACLALTQAAVRPRRDTASMLSEWQKNTEEFAKTIEEQFKALANSQNTKDVTKALQDGSNTVVQQLTSLSNSLQGALGDANGKTKEVLEQTKQNLDRTVEELRRAHPDVERQATELKDKLQAAVQNTVQETQKLVKEVSTNVEQTNEKLTPKIKQAYDDFVTQVQEVQKKIQEAANKQ